MARRCFKANGNVRSAVQPQKSCVEQIGEEAKLPYTNSAELAEALWARRNQHPDLTNVHLNVIAWLVASHLCILIM